MVQEPPTPDADSADSADTQGSSPPDEEPIPDESPLLGRTGVQEEVLAELARAEAEMRGAKPAEDATGTQV